MTDGEKRNQRIRDLARDVTRDAFALAGLVGLSVGVGREFGVNWGLIAAGVVMLAAIAAGTRGRRAP